MLTLFSDYTFIIRRVNEEEVDELLDIAKEHNLPILCPNLFKHKGGFSNIAISNKGLGGHISELCYYYGVNRKRCFSWRPLKDINELKEYLEVAWQRGGGMSHIHQYFVSTRNKDDVKQMVKLLIINGYTPLHGISNIDTINPYPVGITIDNKVMAFWPNSTTIMACYISSHHARALDPKDIIDNYDLLINKLDIIFYNKLLLKKMPKQASNIDY